MEIDWLILCCTSLCCRSCVQYDQLHSRNDKIGDWLRIISTYITIIRWFGSVLRSSLNSRIKNCKSPIDNSTETTNNLISISSDNDDSSTSTNKSTPVYHFGVDRLKKHCSVRLARYDIHRARLHAHICSMPVLESKTFQPATRQSQGRQQVMFGVFR
jgi:hypothetical protein